MFGLSAAHSQPMVHLQDEISRLHQQLESSSQRCDSLAQQVHTLSAQNATLLEENAVLRREQRAAPHVDTQVNAVLNAARSLQLATAAGAAAPTPAVPDAAVLRRAMAEMRRSMTVVDWGALASSSVSGAGAGFSIVATEKGARLVSDSSGGGARSGSAMAGGSSDGSEIGGGGGGVKSRRPTANFIVQCALDEMAPPLEQIVESQRRATHAEAANRSLKKQLEDAHKDSVLKEREWGDHMAELRRLRTILRFSVLKQDSDKLHETCAVVDDLEMQIHRLRREKTAIERGLAGGSPTARAAGAGGSGSPSSSAAYMASSTRTTTTTTTTTTASATGAGSAATTRPNQRGGGARPSTAMVGRLRSAAAVSLSDERPNAASAAAEAFASESSKDRNDDRDEESREEQERPHPATAASPHNRSKSSHQQHQPQRAQNRPGDDSMIFSDDEDEDEDDIIDRRFSSSRSPKTKGARRDDGDDEEDDGAAVLPQVNPEAPNIVSIGDRAAAYMQRKKKEEEEAKQLAELREQQRKQQQSKRPQSAATGAAGRRGGAGDLTKPRSVASYFAACAAASAMRTPDVSPEEVLHAMDVTGTHHGCGGPVNLIRRLNSKLTGKPEEGRPQQREQCGGSSSDVTSRLYSRPSSALLARRVGSAYSQHAGSSAVGSRGSPRRDRKQPQRDEQQQHHQRPEPEFASQLARANLSQQQLLHQQQRAAITAALSGTTAGEMVMMSSSSSSSASSAETHSQQHHHHHQHRQQQQHQQKTTGGTGSSEQRYPTTPQRPTSSSSSTPHRMPARRTPAASPNSGGSSGVGALSPREASRASAAAGMCHRSVVLESTMESDSYQNPFSNAFGGGGGIAGVIKSRAGGSSASSAPQVAKIGGRSVPLFFA